MSHQASAWALDARRTGRLTAGARLVLATMADYADPDGHGSYPSNATIAARIDVTPDNVRKHKRTLEAAGLIVKGDQALVAHYPADKRPTVYNLAIRRDPSDSMPRSSDPSGQTRATHRTEPDRPIAGDAQTKNITTPENSPQTPHADLDDDIDHDSPQALAVEHARAEAQRRRLTAEGEIPTPMPAEVKALLKRRDEETSA